MRIDKSPEFWGALASEAERSHANASFFRRKQVDAVVKKLQREIRQAKRERRKVS